MDHILDWMDKVWMYNRTKYCFILRGNIGVGKSTFAQNLKDIAEYHFRPLEICSADHFFYDKHGNYVYNKNKIKEAHEACFKKFKEAAMKKSNIVIGN